jgi:hypothetical protein
MEVNGINHTVCPKMNMQKIKSSVITLHNNRVKIK